MPEATRIPPNGAPPALPEQVRAWCGSAIAELHDRSFASGSSHAAEACGTLYYSAGLFAEAAEWFRRAAAGERCARSRYLLGLSLSGMAALEEALTALREAIAIQPDLYMAYYQMARIHCSQKRLDLARAVLGQALERFRGTTYEAFVHNELALTYEQEGDLEAAVRCAQRAAEVEEADPIPARVNLAMLLYKRGRTADARAILQDLVAGRPPGAILHPSAHTTFLANFTLAGLALEAGEPRSARRFIVRALRASPGSAAAWNSLAIASAACGRRAAARRALRRALQIVPDFGAARRNLDRLERRQGEGGL